MKRELIGLMNDLGNGVALHSAFDFHTYLSWLELTTEQPGHGAALQAWGDAIDVLETIMSEGRK